MTDNERIERSMRRKSHHERLHFLMTLKRIERERSELDAECVGSMKRTSWQNQRGPVELVDI